LGKEREHGWAAQSFPYPGAKTEKRGGLNWVVEIALRCSPRWAPGPGAITKRGFENYLKTQNQEEDADRASHETKGSVGGPGRVTLLWGGRQGQNGSTPSIQHADPHCARGSLKAESNYRLKAQEGNGGDQSGKGGPC